MSVATRDNAAKRGAGIVSVILVHVAIVTALLSGLDRRVAQLLPPQLLEVRILKEVKKPSSPPHLVAPPQAPPKTRIEPPRAHIPPPRVQVPSPPPAPAAITAVTTAPAPPAVVAAPPVLVAPVIDATHSCRLPEYPSASRYAGETGAVVLRFLVDEDGVAVDSQVEASSGHARLDEAAKAALSLCRFQPGTLDGRAVRAWARIRYVWKLN